jgi:PPP family 3-phenylpropionic acid transporter
VGFGLSSLIIGYLIQPLGIRVIFIGYLLCSTIALIISTRLPGPRLVTAEPFWINLRIFVRDARWYGFLLGLFLVGVAFAMFNNYLILFLKFLGAKESLFGLGTAFAGLSELPVFFLSAMILKRFGPKRMLVFAIFITGVRSLLTSFLINPNWVLPLQLLHGLTFSLLWASGVSYAGEISPSGLGASAQALLGVTLYSVGGGSGVILGSQLFNLVGPANLFRIGAVISVMGMLLMAFFTRNHKDKATKIRENIISTHIRL